MDFLTIGGPGSNAASSYNFGSTVALRGGNMGDLIVSELHGPKYEAAYRNSLFMGGLQATSSTALPSGLTATYTGGLTLNNPLGNTKNLVIRQASLTVILATTTVCSIGLGVGYSTSVAIAGTLTAIASNTGLVGPAGTTATGVLYSSASVTLQAVPYLAMPLVSLGTGATTVVMGGAPQVFDIGGGIVLQPGAYCCFVSSAAGTASSLFLGFQWEEVPV